MEPTQMPTKTQETWLKPSDSSKKSTVKPFLALTEFQSLGQEITKAPETRAFLKLHIQHAKVSFQ
jgi:hypothetical protein